MFSPIQMQGIIRYGNRLRIKDEDLAQHSYSVAYYCFEIARNYNIPDDIRNEAIAMAIIHDIGEVFTSDLPHDVKYENPELKELCDKLEDKYIQKELPEVYNLWQKAESKDKKSISSVMVKIADSMSVRDYCQREIILGNNTHEIMEILENANERIKSQEIKLEKELNWYGERY